MSVDVSRFPQELIEGENWTMIHPDPEWIWTVEHEGRIAGFLMAAGGHGIAFILRLRMAKDAPRHLLTKLLRAFLGDVKERGYVIYMSWMNLSRSEEANLTRIIMRSGGYVLDMTHALCAGSVEQAARY